jgi:hypothetical protein
MMKKISLLCLLMGINIAANAQLDMGALQDAHNAANVSRHLPTYLGDRFANFEVNVFNPYISLGSNFVNAGDVRDYLNADKITNAMIGASVNRMHSQDNIIAGSADIALLNMAFNIGNKEGHKTFSFGFGVNERIEISSVFNQDAFLLAYSGNKQFAGQTIQIVPRFNGLAFTEYYVAAAFNIRPRNTDWVIKPAVRLSYLAGQASVEMRQGNSITLYTEPEGRYLDFGLDYNINTSLGGDSVKLTGSSFNLNDKNFQNGSGSGFGMDMALRVSPGPGIQFNVGLMDVGSIRFTKNTTNIYNHSSYRYEGQELTFAEDQSIDLDSLAEFAKPNYSYNSYTVELPTKLVITGSIGMNRHERRSGSYYGNQLSGMYVQGFLNYLTAATVPYIAVGYTHSFGGVLNLGANAGVGGLWGGNVGLIASLKAGPLLFGLRSNNILPLIAPNAGRGVDAGMLLGLAF